MNMTELVQLSCSSTRYLIGWLGLSVRGAVKENPVLYALFLLLLVSALVSAQANGDRELSVDFWV
jgi:hypothetical protein